jgi:hypothetical protein
METNVISCDCRTLMHTIQLITFQDDPPAAFLLFLKSNRGTWWERVKEAFQHLFRRKDGICEQEIVLTKYNAVQLRDSLSRFLHE